MSKYVIQVTSGPRKGEFYKDPLCGCSPNVKEAGVYTAENIHRVHSSLAVATPRRRMIPWETALRRAHGTA